MVPLSCIFEKKIAGHICLRLPYGKSNGMCHTMKPILSTHPEVQYFGCFTKSALDR